MKGRICAIFFVVCLGVFACGNVFNEEIDKAKVLGELNDPIVQEINDKESFFSLIDGPAYDEAVVILEEDDGGMFIAGNTISYGQGGYDVWCIKTDRFGNIITKKVMGGTKDDRIRSAKRTAGGGYILAGETDSFGAGNKDAWLVKLSNSMVVEWEKTYGGTGNDSAREVFQEKGGQYVLIGETDSFGEGLLDVLFLKVNQLGKYEVDVTHGLEIDEYPSGAVYHEDTTDYDIIVNTKNISRSNTVNMLKVCFDGALGRELTLNGGSHTYATGITLDGEGGIVITGYLYEYSDYLYRIWAVKMDWWFEIIWERKYDFPGDGYARNITRAKDGTFLISGSVDVTGKGDFDMVLLNIDTDGDVVRARTFDGGGFDEIEYAVTTSAGRVWGVGKSTSLGSDGYSSTILAVNQEWGFDEESAIVALDWTVPFNLTDTKRIPGIELTENFKHANVIERESASIVSEDFGYCEFH